MCTVTCVEGLASSCIGIEVRARGYAAAHESQLLTRRTGVADQPGLRVQGDVAPRADCIGSIDDAD